MGWALGPLHLDKKDSD
ncbi:hypothetical protein Zm00014a_017179 [Zea mays]|uniref:Uncharacterized protein n=1 Tax=Zea mays TaxID=4577 RepID=A0A317Y6Y9_MAIZE|nr:hypothetical protein Zm00014a_017179 [Zea mays]